jgi:TetR/AcrR family transcriptional repressor of nem operon
MGRPRQFEEAVAVDAAVALFRQRGYASTSVDHLVEATGMHRGSLYGVFGSKHELFMRALEAVDVIERAVERLDIVLVGLLELAPTGSRVRERIAGLIETHGITNEHLAGRLLARAGLHDGKETG